MVVYGDTLLDDFVYLLSVTPRFIDSKLTRCTCFVTGFVIETNQKPDCQPQFPGHQPQLILDDTGAKAPVNFAKRVGNQGQLSMSVYYHS